MKNFKKPALVIVLIMIILLVVIVFVFEIFIIPFFHDIEEQLRQRIKVVDNFLEDHESRSSRVHRTELARSSGVSLN